MLAATLLALGSAFVHAGWNLVVKQSSGDRLIALWGQFFLAAIIALPILIAFGEVERGVWSNVAVSGVAHLPYCVFLARGYERGDFSVVYPIARGGGAVLAAAGGWLFLHDHLSWWSALGIVVVGVGLAGLAGSSAGNRSAVAYALVVAATIGVYSVSDAAGVRRVGWVYALATPLGTSITTTAYLLWRGRGPAMRTALCTQLPRFSALGSATLLTYGMVQYAFRLAPVGYVNGLRESSVVIGIFVGARHLQERVGRQRVVAALVVLSGLVLLVVSRL